MTNPTTTTPPPITTPQNKVLNEDHRVSQNFYDSDLMFQHFFKTESSQAAQQFMDKRLQKLGELAANTMNALSLRADKQGPTLVKRNFYGETINDIQFHPAYNQLLEIAVLDKLFTGAMFLTEKAGGSDVGANMVTATHYKEDYYLLNGEKWFCSNANAEVIFALARTDPKIKGTKGLSIFLIEKQRPDGTKNEMDIIRLKDKLGVRSMASAEIMLTDTLGKLVGEEGQGFKIMTDMINLSRLYNSVAALSGNRRALIEAYQFLNHRTVFGSNALKKPLIRTKLTELGANYVADFYLTWHAIKTLDLADNGDDDAKQLLRLITPMVKKRTAENGVYSIRESMELMGGMGYIEDGVLPKVMRDAMVLPIWEGASNIMVLDMLRAATKSKGAPKLFKDIRNQFVKISRKEQKFLLPAFHQVIRIFQQLPDFSQELKETTAKPLFEQLTALYQIALLLKYKDPQSEQWINPALAYLMSQFRDSKLTIKHPNTTDTIKDLMAWEF